MKPHISVSSVSERDVDLLLLEEFVATASFGSWFVSEACSNSPQIGTCISAQRSVTQSSGESDLELIFIGADGSRLLVMIENKIAAGFQPMQADRYRLRGAGYINRQECDSLLTILTAPQAYFGSTDSSKGFDGRVTYEAILKWFNSMPEFGARQSYKATVLQAAIDKSSLGYQPVEDAVATRFWKDYWELVRAHAPELRMPEPGVKTAGATFIGLKPAGLPIGSDIVHKLTGTKGAANGFMDLQLPGMGDDALVLDEALQSFLDEGMSVVRASKSAAIRLIVPPVDPNRDAIPQTQAIIKGLSAAKRLLVWIQSNKDIGAAIDQIAQQGVAPWASSAPSPRSRR
ncbi:MAG: hypothetical protein ACI9JZ_001735 [Lentimonas sp.]|jgi:hypothetical protein